MSKFVTLVFRQETKEERDRVRELSIMDQCRAWSTDHEIQRLTLIEEALDEENIELAQEIISSLNVWEYNDLEAFKNREQ